MNSENRLRPKFTFETGFLIEEIRSAERVNFYFLIPLATVAVHFHSTPHDHYD